MPVNRLNKLEIRRALRKTLDRLNILERSRILDFIAFNPQDAPIVLPGVGKPIPIATVSVSPSSPSTNSAATLSATATISGGDTIASVQFRVNGQNQGSPDTTSPYSTSWTPTQEGVFVIQAVATSAQGQIGFSPALPVTVTAPVLPVPTVVVSAPRGGVINAAQTLSATATISGDTIASVQFKVNGSDQGSPDTTSPYSASWTPTTKGSYSITAVGTGSQGGVGTSSAAVVSIFDTKINGGGNAAGTSLGAVGGDYILFDNNQSAGGNASIMNIFVSGVQVGAFNYPDTAYNGKPFVYFNSGNSTFYSGTIQGTVNF